VYNADKKQAVICTDICINASDLPPIYMSKCGCPCEVQGELHFFYSVKSHVSEKS